MEKGREQVKDLASKLTLPLQVLISGGVGPALCDVTLDGVAKAFDVRLTPDAELLAELQRLHGTDNTPSFLKVTSSFLLNFSAIATSNSLRTKAP